MDLRYGIVVTLAVVVFLSSPAMAQTLTVGAGQEFLTIQDAVNASEWGDTIEVYPGTYNETVELVWKDVRIVSYSGNPEDTILASVGRTGTGIHVEDNSQLVLSGFTVTGYEYGVYSEWVSSSIVLNNNVFKDNEQGARLYNKITIDIHDNKFIDNQWGLSLGRSTVYPPGKEIRDNLFSGNDIGYYNYDSSIVVFSGNTLTNNTRAISTIYTSGTIRDNMIYDNEWGITGAPSGLTAYNNYLNNNVNAEIIPNGQDVYFNVPTVIGLNIIGGPSVGGNYWATPDGTGHSQVTPDLDMDGFCDNPYSVHVWHDTNGNEIAVIIDHHPLADWDESKPSQEIPEFPTIALPVMAILGLALFFKRRN